MCKLHKFHLKTLVGLPIDKITLAGIRRRAFEMSSEKYKKNCPRLTARTTQHDFIFFVLVDEYEFPFGVYDFYCAIVGKVFGNFAHTLN